MAAIRASAAAACTPLRGAIARVRLARRGALGRVSATEVQPAGSGLGAAKVRRRDGTSGETVSVDVRTGASRGTRRPDDVDGDVVESL